MISIAIGIVDSTKRRFHSYVDVLTAARDARYLAKEKVESCWVVDDPQKSRNDDRDLLESDEENQEMASSRILVVEPDGAMACLLQETLALEGYIVEVTASADDALEMAKYDPHPDLVLLESNFSDRMMDGWKLCQKLKADNELSKIWVIMATSHPDQSRALEAGAGFGVPEPTPSWGNMIAFEWVVRDGNPWATWAPALAIWAVILGAMMMADGLAEADDRA